MKRRKLNEKELNEIIENLKDADYVLLETNKGATIFGNIPGILSMYAELASHLLEESKIPKEYILDACKLGLGMDNMFKKDLDKDLDKIHETIEKLVDILKDLRKGDK